MAVREEPWRINLEEDREMRFFSISEVWKCISSLETAETDRKLANGDRDLPKSTLAVTMRLEIPISVRIVRGKYPKNLYFS